MVNGEGVLVGVRVGVPGLVQATYVKAYVERIRMQGCIIIVTCMQ